MFYKNATRIACGVLINVVGLIVAAHHLVGRLWP
jgi:hypothetical protein